MVRELRRWMSVVSKSQFRVRARIIVNGEVLKTYVINYPEEVLKLAVINNVRNYLILYGVGDVEAEVIKDLTTSQELVRAFKALWVRGLVPVDYCWSISSWAMDVVYVSTEGKVRYGKRIPKNLRALKEWLEALKILMILERGRLSDIKRLGALV